MVTQLIPSAVLTRFVGTNLDLAFEGLPGQIGTITKITTFRDRRGDVIALVYLDGRQLSSFTEVGTLVDLTDLVKNFGV